MVSSYYKIPTHTFTVFNTAVQLHMDIPHTTKLYHIRFLIAFVQISGRLHYELRMHTHTHVHVTTSLAHYTHTHTLGLSHIVWMIPYSRRTREHLPRRKGLRGRDGNPLRWRVSYVRRKGRRESVNRPHLTKTHVTICTRSRMHTHGEQNIATYGYTTHH